jgi:hypothetical protein
LSLDPGSRIRLIPTWPRRRLRAHTDTPGVNDSAGEMGLLLIMVAERHNDSDCKMNGRQSTSRVQTNTQRHDSWWLSILVFGFALLAISSFAMRLISIPILPHLPAPTGPFLVGTAPWNPRVTGEHVQRAEDCRLTTQLWYPAKPGDGQPRAPYSWSAGVLSLRHWVRIEARLDAPLATARARYPVLLFLPGWSGGGNENTALVQDLASRGFIVVAIGYDSATCAQDEASSSQPKSANMDFSSPAAFERTVQIADRKISRVAVGAVEILDALVELNRSDSAGRFTGRLDLNEVGAIGHSLGGAIAVQICWLDARVKIAIDIDGWLFDTAPGGWIRQPFMLMGGEGPPPTASDLAASDGWRRYPAILTKQTYDRRQTAFASYGGITLWIKGARHEDYADYPFMTRSAVLFSRYPDGSAIRIAADYIAAFFELTLRGKQNSLFERPPSSVVLHVWNRSAASTAQAR